MEINRNRDRLRRPRHQQPLANVQNRAQNERARHDSRRTNPLGDAGEVNRKQKADQRRRNHHLRQVDCRKVL